MRLNQYLAHNTDLSRRSADTAIAAGEVMVNDQLPTPGYQVKAGDMITYKGELVKTHDATTTILFHKPVGFICSKNGQGGKTIYDILPVKFHNLNPVGRLDKNSSGLLLLTNDGNLAHSLTHPSFQKIKIYEIVLNKALEPLHQQMINDYGIQLEDGPSKLMLEKSAGDAKHFTVTMNEGRNRQIRRTFEALGYTVTQLHRTHFGDWSLDNLQPGQTKQA